MPDVTLPNGVVIEDVPETATREEIKQRAIAAGLATEADFVSKREVNPLLQTAQKLAQGATFGFGDEISAAMVGSMASLTGKGTFRDAYNYSLGNIRADEEAFAQQNPKTAIASEILGAVGTGGLAGGRLLANTGRMSTVGRYAAISAVGAAEGALYGAGTAKQNRTEKALQGMLVGAVAAPIGTKVTDWALRSGGAIARYAARKLGDTPRDQAVRAVRRFAEMEGIDADDAIRMLDDLGPEATLADLGENFRALARSAADQAGSFKGQARNMLNQRQLGQQQRLMEAAEVAAGQTAGDFNQARQALIESRRITAQPLYDQAFELGVNKSTALESIMQRPTFAQALRKAEKLAADEGVDLDGNLLRQLHYAKMAVDDLHKAARQGGEANRARILDILRKDLLTEIDSQNPLYQAARDAYSGDSAMINAMDSGLDFFKSSADEVAEAMKGMAASERDLFKLGAVRSIRDELDRTYMNADATRKLLGTKSIRDKLGMIFDEPEEFIRTALGESEFTRTRQVLTGGSPTAERLAGQGALSDVIQPEIARALASKDAVGLGLNVLKVLTEQKVTPELVEELAQTMLKQGMKPDEVRRIFANPALSRQLGVTYRQVVVPAIAGALVPASQAAQQTHQ